jgi:hypothetical protein
MTFRNPEVQARATSIFKAREAQRLDAPQAMADYRAAELAIRKRTQRLREERLARERALEPAE